MLQDTSYIKHNITNNREIDEVGDEIFKNVPYRWSHGATDTHLGDGLIVYSIIQYMRAKVCVCLGSGGGFIHRIMTQARIDLHKQGIFEGDDNYSWGDIGTTYIVDAMNGIGGKVDWFAEESFFRRQFCPRIINDKVKDRGDFEDWSGPVRLVKEIDTTKWEIFNLFNFGVIKNKPASTGLTLIRKK